MGIQLRILFVEDSVNDATLLRHELTKGGFDLQAERVETAEALRSALNLGIWDIVLSDYNIPGFGGFEALKIVRDSGKDLPVIIVSGTIGEDAAIEALKAGAANYVLKGNLKRLVPAIERELREAVVRRERNLAEEMIDWQAWHDSLTGLPNRLSFQNQLDQVLAAMTRDEDLAAILLLDLDGFKYINETLGHAVGDRMLQEISFRLSTQIGADATFARMGGDEFIVLLPNLEKVEAALFFAQNLLDMLAAPILLDGNEFFCTGSIGISIFPESGRDSRALLQHADLAMYEAKRQGRGCFFVYHGEMNSTTADHFTLTNNLRKAIDRDELVLHYQPLIDMFSGKATGVEALVRWPHPDFGLLFPGKFIPAAEETNLISKLGDWVLRQGCRKGAEWRAAGLAWTVSINASPRQFRGNNLVNTIKSAVTNAGFDYSALILELTEGSLLLHDQEVIATLDEVRALGVRIAVDDFGTGYSSLSYLRHLPIDILKIDRSFVRGLASDGADRTVVRAIIDLAHGLRLDVVAEGVETEAQRAILASLGCDKYQGFYFSPAVPPEDLESLLAETPAGS